MEGYWLAVVLTTPETKSCTASLPLTTSPSCFDTQAIYVAVLVLALSAAALALSVDVEAETSVSTSVEVDTQRGGGKIARKASVAKVAQVQTRKPQTPTCGGLVVLK
jgi:hypothetical protein